MEIAVRIAGLVFGLLLGFSAGLYLLMYITKGENLRGVLNDKTKKIWLGTFGWMTALAGAWAGWTAAGALMGAAH